jgi:uncharacterized protein YccT (UPF0319 family)
MIDYERYTRQIRVEYKHYPDDAFVNGRTAVMERLLQKPRLYETTTLRTAWESRARYNVSTEIAQLKATAAAMKTTATPTSVAAIAGVPVPEAPTNATTATAAKL